MGSYFHGWRRKFGVLTLVIACVCAAGWVRGLVKHEWIDLRRITSKLQSTKWIAGLQNNRHAIVLLAIEYRPIDEIPGLTISPSKRGQPTPKELLAMGYASVHRRPFASLPHWSIVIPLTLLSAWLLLSKPRAKTTPEKQPATI